MKKQLIVSSAPYIKNGETAHCLMFDVFIAAVPVVAVSTYFFGFYALLVIAVCVIVSMLTEMLIQTIFSPQKFQFRNFIYNILTNDKLTVLDGSAAVTGMLLAFTLPPDVPLWIPITGSVVAISIGKHVFGGIGYNIFNPALVGRAFLLASWPGHMTSWKSPVSWCSTINTYVDAVTTATPLSLMKLQNQSTSILDLFVGNTGGSLGETSIAAILIGAAYLLYKRTITWQIPFSYIGTVLVISLLLGQNPAFHLFAGGLMLGAFFMATDVVTSPVTRSGRLVFGCGAGIITIFIRQFGGYPEGVCYAILLMNALTPLIERYTVRKYKPSEVGIKFIKDILKDR